jgi:spore coat polysaccharide biosynthesis predicted glycosyltransferase SpsG
MSYNISKTELEKFSLFSICSKKFGYGHYNRIENLISILENKKKKFVHYSYGEKFKNKNHFFERLKIEVNLGNNIVLDITNDLFLDLITVSKIKKILNEKKTNRIYIIDSPTKKNLSTILNLDYTKTLIPFEVDGEMKKKLSKIKKKKIGFEYFIYSSKNLKKRKKIYDITLSFGGSDNYEGTFYVLKLLDYLKIKKNIIVVIGKYFKGKYKKKILQFCKQKKFKAKSFSKNFNDILNISRLLITNSGLTKYEGVAHSLPVIVFSDSKESQKIDKVFIKKTKQIHFSYLKRQQDDIIKLKSILQKKLKIKSVDKNINKSYMDKIKNFFKK